MVSDLLKILQAIQAAHSDEEKKKLEHELSDAVQTEIRNLFEGYPKRRRSFDAIRENLGIFDPPEKQEELKNILFSMGARPQKGKGGKNYWQLPEPEPDAPHPPVLHQPVGDFAG